MSGKDRPGKPAREPSRAKSPTMADIARLAGVSTATVSRSLAGLPPITEETRLRVERAAAQAGYKINRHARSLRSQRSKIILVIIPNLANQNFPDLLMSIDRAAFELGYDVMIGHLGIDPARSERLADELFTGGIDGILLTSPYCPDRIAKRLAFGDRLPVVRTLSPGDDNSYVASVLIDEEKAAFDVARHLVDQGYRRIAHLSGPLDQPVARQREAGWRRAVIEAGFVAEAPDLVLGGFEIEDGRDAARRLLARGTLPDAIFCSNDASAFGLITELKRAGIHVPADIAVAGFDDLTFSELFDPPLTTIRLPRQKMAELSLFHLTQLIDGHADIGNQIVPHELVIRESTTPPAGRHSRQ